MKKIIFTIIAFVLICKSVNAQTVYVGVQDWGVPSSYLEGGKIAFETDIPLFFQTSVKFKRFDGSTQVKVEAFYVRTEPGGGERTISNVITVNTSDFTQASGVYWSKEFVQTTTALKYAEHNVLRLKWRYWDTYSGSEAKWSPYYYASKTYQFIDRKNLGNPPGTVPVYSYFSQEGNDHYSTTAETIGGLGSYWKKDGINFYAFNYQAPGTVPIYSYINPNTPDHFSSRFVMTDPYWTLEGIGFYAYDTPGEKRAPVYSYINKDKSDHFISPDPNVASSYWINEGIAFYSPIN